MRYPALVISSSLLISAVSAETSSLDPLVVTATRSEQPLSQTLAATTVFTREDIEQSQARDLFTLLGQASGVSLVRSGAEGTVTSLFLRGTESDQTLILIDGVRAGSASLGSTALQYLPLAHIERIEIVRGPKASLYGADAIGGVIQVFTRRGEGAPSHFVSTGIGSNQTRRVAVGSQGQLNNTRYQVSAQYYNTDGFDTLAASSGFFAFDEPDNDGFEESAFNAQISHSVNSQLELGSSLVYNQGYSEFDFFSGADDADIEFTQANIAGYALLRPTQQLTSKLNLGYYVDEQTTRTVPNPVFDTFDTARYSASLQNDFTPSDSLQTTFGLDYYDDRLKSSTDFLQSRRDNWGAFVQQQWQQQKHSFLASGRVDDNQAYGTHYTWDLAWGYELKDGLRLSSSYGTAFKAPNFNELLFNSAFFIGNPDLSPEESDSIEIALQGQYAHGQWRVSLYQTDINNLIVTVNNFMTFISTTENAEDTRIQGLEAELNHRQGPWSLRSSVSVINPENRSLERQLPRRAKRTLTLDLDHQLGRASLGASFLAKSHSFDDVNNNQRLSGYALVDLRAELDITTEFNLGLRVNNIFDRDYVTNTNFGTPFLNDGTNYQLNLTYNF